ncbi:hypothetical protein [Sphingobium yanoikuyae]|uniref:hypothetical protein n=1 Tax=Sphingobium yanoikuyae TaxID=13690 RepID=UPI00137774CB|nr:hypothetical protein [Sphingobium yanoikuyae]NBB38652.1 hypothetical protein [Sphingobium yanoikuyae]
MSAAIYSKLELALARVLTRNRRGLTDGPCPPEALTAHAYFDLGDKEGDEDAPFDMQVVPQRLPFEMLWIVVPYRGIAIVALAEKMTNGMVRPDYLWYPQQIEGQKIRVTEEELDDKATFIVDRALHRILTNHLESIDSEIRTKINTARAKPQDNPVGPLPEWIRISRKPAEASAPAPNDHETRPVQPHDRRGHWRTYKRSGKTIWINEMKIKGGSDEPRKYKMAS